MANIKIVIDGALMDGHKITFKAPCDCSGIDYLKVCYVKDSKQESKLFTMKDAHGNTLTGLGNLFEEGAYVHAILDINKGFAYIQNPDTNGYLEGRLDQCVTFGNFIVTGTAEKATLTINLDAAVGGSDLPVAEEGRF